jgi:hypothetical protein
MLVIILLCPTEVFAAETRASHYLNSYTAYIYPAGWGKVQVWFSVNGTGDMDEIGALSIQLYESKDNETWTWVKTFHFADYPGMLGYNNYFHDGYVEYNGTIGRYYQAYVCVWAGKDGDGDTRYFWTTPKKATLFAG